METTITTFGRWQARVTEFYAAVIQYKGAAYPWPSQWRLTLDALGDVCFTWVVLDAFEVQIQTDGSGAWLGSVNGVDHGACGGPGDTLRFLCDPIRSNLIRMRAQIDDLTES